MRNKGTGHVIFLNLIISTWHLTDAPWGIGTYVGLRERVLIRENPKMTANSYAHCVIIVVSNFKDICMEILF